MAERSSAISQGVSTFHFDFQKNLQCPKLSCQDYYYSSKLTLYGFGVHSGETGKGTVYVWPESIAPKNPDTLLSCLDYHLRQNEGYNRKWNIFWADNTRSQNKNFTVAFYLAHLVASGFRERCDLKFLIAGHSYGEVDRDSGRAESILRTEKTIETPTDYIDLINGSALHPKLSWFEMEQGQFKCFSQWLRTIYKDKRKDISNRQYRLTDMCHLNFGIGERVDPADGQIRTYSHPNVVWMRKTLDPQETPVEVDFRINTEQRVNLRTANLATLNYSIIELPEHKRAALRKLLKYLSPTGKEYFQKFELQSQRH